MRTQRGFTLIAVLAAMVILALATQGAMFVVSQQAQRERERELLVIGAQYVRAIRSYYESSPGTAKRYPSELAELVEDHRFVTIRRHLRALYTDPVNGNAALAPLLRADGTIEGVASRSEAAPIRTAPIRRGDLTLEGAQHYSDWQFVFRPETAASNGRAAP